MSKAERLLAYSLLSLITSKPLASAPMTGVNEEDEQYNIKGKGLLNEDGAWCWREDCQGAYFGISFQNFLCSWLRLFRLLEAYEGNAKDFGYIAKYC